MNTVFQEALSMFSALVFVIGGLASITLIYFAVLNLGDGNYRSSAYCALALVVIGPLTILVRGFI